MILIKNGRVVDPVTGTDEIMDVLVDGNTIAKTGKDLNVDCAEVIDATGLVIAPGLVDTHVHFRDPGFTYKEDIIPELRLQPGADLPWLYVWRIQSLQWIIWIL